MQNFPNPIFKTEINKSLEETITVFKNIFFFNAGKYTNIKFNDALNIFNCDNLQNLYLVHFIIQLNPSSENKTSVSIEIQNPLGTMQKYMMENRLNDFVELFSTTLKQPSEELENKKKRITELRAQDSNSSSSAMIIGLLIGLLIIAVLAYFLYFHKNN